jgi:hypothetical protein
MALDVAEHHGDGQDYTEESNGRSQKWYFAVFEGDIKDINVKKRKILM